MSNKMVCTVPSDIKMVCTIPSDIKMVCTIPSDIGMSKKESTSDIGIQVDMGDAQMEGDIQMDGDIQVEVEDEKAKEEATAEDDPSELHVCPYCKAFFATAQYLKAHMRRKCIRAENLNNPLKCEHCPLSFKKKHQLTRHILQHTGERPFKCGSCEKTFLIKSHLKRHNVIHLPPEELLHKCDQCDKAFAWPSQLSAHMKSHSGEKRFKCGICARMFLHLSSLRTHTSSRHTVNGLFHCVVCKEKFEDVANLIIHMREHNEDESVKCERCFAYFSTLHDLETHFCTNFGGKPLICSTCMEEFEDTKTFCNHKCMEISSNRKCGCCLKEFTSLWHLKEHLITHTGEKAYKCDNCKTGFRRKRELQLHMTRHDSERTFSCTVCTNTFPSDHYLKKHMLQEHREKKFNCHICEHSFMHNSALKNHLDFHLRTGNKMFGKKYHRKNELFIPGLAEQIRNVDQVDETVVKKKETNKLDDSNKEAISNAEQKDSLMDVNSDSCRKRNLETINIGNNSIETSRRNLAAHVLPDEQTKPITNTSLNNVNENKNESFNMKNNEKVSNELPILNLMPTEFLIADSNTNFESNTIENLFTVENSSTVQTSTSKEEILTSAAHLYKIGTEAEISRLIEEIQHNSTVLGWNEHSTTKENKAKGFLMEDNNTKLVVEKNKQVTDNVKATVVTDNVKENVAADSVKENVATDNVKQSEANEEETIYEVDEVSGETYVRCLTCFLQFQSHSLLLRHHKEYHDIGKPYKCDICSRHFANAANLTIHLSMHKNNKEDKHKYECQHCTNPFKVIYKLREHLRVKHNINNNQLTDLELHIQHSVKNKSVETVESVGDVESVESIVTSLGSDNNILSIGLNNIQTEEEERLFISNVLTSDDTSKYLHDYNHLYQVNESMTDVSHQMDTPIAINDINTQHEEIIVSEPQNKFEYMLSHHDSDQDLI